LGCFSSSRSGEQELMRIAITLLLLLIIPEAVGYGASRTWKFRNGNEIKAEFIGGVLDNKIVLKAPGNRRLYFRLSEFSLADRDYIVDHFTKRNDPKDIQQLLAVMAFENTVRAIDPDAPANEGESHTAPAARNPLASNPFNPLANPNALQQGSARETEMYGIPLPSPELLVEDQVRTWTSLTGIKSLYRFDRALAPGHFRLKKADGTSNEFAIVNFSKEDVDYVQQLIQNDLARPVFPEGNGFQSLTPEDVSRGYKVWTDRRNVPLIGKFVALRGKNVVIEVAGAEQEYPKAGLSESDRDWVDAEVKRRAEAAQQAAADNPSPAGRSSFPQSRFSPFGNTGGGAHAENTPRNSFGGSSQSSFPQMEFQFYCRRCGHEWTRTDTSIDHCPKCTGSNSGQSASASGQQPSSFGHSASSSGSSTPYQAPTASSASTFDSSSPASFGAATTSGSGTKDSQGVLMTIVYVLMGVGLLAGIAAGLFRAFG
jgi:hypothetical protein